MGLGKIQYSNARLRQSILNAGVLWRCPQNAHGWKGILPLGISDRHPIELSDYSPDAARAVAEKTAWHYMGMAGKIRNDLVAMSYYFRAARIAEREGLSCLMQEAGGIYISFALVLGKTENLNQIARRFGVEGRLGQMKTMLAYATA